MSAAVSAVQVADGAHALDELANARWDLVVSDIELPGADGLQIL